MKKLIEKDKLKRATILELEKRAKVLKSLFQNFNLPILIRWNSFLKLKKIGCQIKKVSISARCVESVNKKRFSKQTNFSRHLYLRSLRSGQYYGVSKAYW